MSGRKMTIMIHMGFIFTQPDASAGEKDAAHEKLIQPFSQTYLMY